MNLSNNGKKACLFLILLPLLFAGCKFAERIFKAPHKPPPPKEEFRGAWMATVVNLDWPASNRQSVEEQKRDLTALLDSLDAIGINAVLFQARTAADALYASVYDPWSYWLTGEQGRAPDPFFDPLRFVTREAHKRGMELHAWLNPFRVQTGEGRYDLSGFHIMRREPDWILEIENGPEASYTMLDPGLPEVRDYVTNVVLDIVRRYEVDGIHFDDYFYPYVPVTHHDSLTWKKYRNDFFDREDWRRDNINRLVAQVYDSLQTLAPHVTFGISPYGVRKNSDTGSSATEGYHLLYADGLAWLQEQTVDYINPQLYFEIGNNEADFALLLDFWAGAADHHQRHMYAGLSPYKLLPPYDWDLDQLGNQHILMIENGMVHGAVFFRTSHLLANHKGYTDVLRNELYRYPALTPSMSWKCQLPPPAVEQLVASRKADGKIELSWKKGRTGQDETDTARFVVYRLDASSRSYNTITARSEQSGSDGLRSVKLATEEQPDEVHVAREQRDQNHLTVERGSAWRRSGPEWTKEMESALRVENRIGITGMTRYKDRWHADWKEAVYMVTAVSHNSIESAPVVVNVKHDEEHVAWKNTERGRP